MNDIMKALLEKTDFDNLKECYPIFIGILRDACNNIYKDSEEDLEDSRKEVNEIQRLIEQQIENLDLRTNLGW